MNPPKHQFHVNWYKVQT